MRRVLSACAFVLVWVSVLRADPAVHRANSVDRIVRFDYPVTNTSAKSEDVTFYLSLPQTNARQEISAVYPEPGYERILDDAYGNRIAVYLDKDVKPGEMRRHGWMAAVRTYAAVWEPAADIPPLTDEDRARYLRDRPNYQINSPVVTGLRDALTRPEMTDIQKVSAIFRYLIENFKYARDDKWDPAPEVLKRKTGSCSEYTYSFIALLRACGIPCRYTGGSIITTQGKSRYDEKVNEDAVFHRWVEVYLKDYGWFPVDGSRGGGTVRRFGNYFNFWGRLPADSLQTYSGDGGSDSFIGWDYLARAKGKVKDSLKADPVCFWIDAPADKLKPTIDDVDAALAKGMPPESVAKIVKDTLSREVLFLMINRLDRSRYPNLGEGLLKTRHPSAVYFSICCEQMGMPVPSFEAFPVMVDDYLRSEILKHRAAGAWNWNSFEHWWRKARAEISFDAQKGVFILNDKKLDLN